MVPTTLEEQKKRAWEKFLANQISESDYHMWVKVYTEQWKFNSPKNYHQGGTITGKKKIVLFAPINCRIRHAGTEERMSDTEIRHFNAE